MSVHTRKRHINQSHYVAPFSEHETSVPWREAFKDGIEGFSEAGLMLRGSRYKADLTQKELAKKIGVKTHHISEMEHGKRTIGKQMAHRLASALNVDYHVFL